MAFSFRFFNLRVLTLGQAYSSCSYSFTATQFSKTPCTQQGLLHDCLTYECHLVTRTVAV